MGIRVELRRAGRFLRKLRVPLGPDSYFRYKHDRNYERKRADRDAKKSVTQIDEQRRDAERGTERERRYDERYVREGEGQSGPERPDAPEGG